MELDLRKTAADAAYIAVGAGVLGFQQAQVRRREAGDRITTLAKDAQDTIGTQTASLATKVGDTATKVGDTATSSVESATATLSKIDVRGWLDPVVVDVKQRIEPVIEQIKGISITAPVQALPEQITKAVEVGKARVQSFRGQSTN